MVSTASCFERAIFRRVRLCQGPSLTLSHKILGTAAVLGFVFTAAHPVTVLVTVLHDGAAWGVTAWSLNVAGYLAGVGFAFVCQEVSNKEATEEVKRMAFWILVWSSITFGVRVLDILMLTGAVVIEEIYHTPQGPTLYANIVSEIVVAFPYAALALLGRRRGRAAGRKVIAYAPTPRNTSRTPYDRALCRYTSRPHRVGPDHPD